MSLFLNQALFRPIPAGHSESNSYKPSFRHSLPATGRSKPLRATVASHRQQFSSKCSVKDWVSGVVEDETLPFGLQQEKMPRHLGLTIDGNRRWAVERGLPNVSGYEVGFGRLHEIVRLSLRCGIDILSVFSFSTKNFNRPQEELNYLFNYFEGFLGDLEHRFSREKVRITVIGDVERFPKSLQEVMRKTEEKTKSNSKLHLVLAMGYGGRDDIVEACRSIANKAKAGIIDPDSITEQVLEQELKTNCCEFPCPDLLIRPSGEQRMSDYMLFQTAYTELYFTHHYIPEFGEDQFLEALRWFQKRSRRFGQ